MDQKRFWILLISLHLFFMGKQLFFNNSMLQDSKEYLYAADNILQHQTLYAWNWNHAFNADWLTKRPALYPLILAGIKSISFGSNWVFLFLIYALQNLASLGSFFIALKILKHYNTAINWTHASILTVLALPQFIYTNTMMSECFLELCLCGLVYLHLCQPLNLKTSFFAALLLIAAVSLKPVVMPLAMVYPLLLLIKTRKSIQLKPLLMSILPLLFVWGISRWNGTRTGYQQYSSISTINLLHYNTYTLLMYRVGTHKADSIVDDIHMKGNLCVSYAEKQNYIQKEAQSIITAHWPTYLFLQIRGMFFCVLDPGRFDISQFFGLSHAKNLLYETNKDHAFQRVIATVLNPLGIILVLLFLWNLYKLLLILKFLFIKAFIWETKILLLCLPLYIVALTGPIGASRFYMPVYPIIFTVLLMLPSWKLNDFKSLSARFQRD